MRTTITVWNLPPEQLGRLRWLGHQLRAEVKAASPREAGMPLRLVVSAPEESAEGETPFPETLLLLSGFEGVQLDRFLTGCREASLAHGAYKAVLTPSNRQWTAVQLMGELREERAALEGTGRKG